MNYINYLDPGAIRHALENLDFIRQHGGDGDIILREELSHAYRERRRRRDAFPHCPGNLAHDLGRMLHIDHKSLVPFAERVAWGHPVFDALQIAAERLRQQPQVQQDRHPAIERAHRKANTPKQRKARRGVS